MTTRKPKSLPEPVSKFHPLKDVCPMCGVGPYEICQKTKGDGWGIWDLKLYHNERVEQCEMDMVFE